MHSQLLQIEYIKVGVPLIIEPLFNLTTLPLSIPATTVGENHFPSSAWLPVAKVAFIASFIGPTVHSISVQKVFTELTLVAAPIRPHQSALAAHLVFEPLSVVLLTISESLDPLSVALVVNPKSVVVCVVLPCVSALSLFGPFVKIPLKPGAVGPCFKREYHSSTPKPCCKSSFHWPSQRTPFELMNIPFPFCLSSSHSPSQTSPSGCRYFPKPLALLSRHQPSQQDPSGHLRIPEPSRLPLFQSPMYTPPDLSSIGQGGSGLRSSFVTVAALSFIFFLVMVYLTWNCLELSRFGAISSTGSISSWVWVMMPLQQQAPIQIFRNQKQKRMNPDPNDGFAKLSDSLMQSVPFERVYFEKPLEQGQTKKNVKMIVQMDKGPGHGLTFKSIIITPISKASQSLGQKTVQVAQQVPGLINQGVRGLIGRLAQKISSFLYSEKPALEAVKVPELQDEPFNPQKEPILLVMPEAVIKAGLREQLDWVEQNKDKFQILNPALKPVKLDSIGSESDESSNASSVFPDGTDVQLVQDNFPIKDDQEYFLISEADFQSLSMQDESVLGEKNQEYQQQVQNQQNETQEQQNLQQTIQQTQMDQSKKITLYPFLPTLITKEQFKKEEEAIYKDAFAAQATNKAFVELQLPKVLLPQEFKVQQIEQEPQYEVQYE